MSDNKKFKLIIAVVVVLLLGLSAVLKNLPKESPKPADNSVASAEIATEQTTETAAEQIVTERKLLKTLIAERAGKITRAEIKREPTRFIARTIITAIIIAITRLYAELWVPTAVAKFSSKVTQKILL